MPHISGCQQLLDALSSARQQLELQIYVDIFWQALAEVDSGSSDSDSLSLSNFSSLSGSSLDSETSDSDDLTDTTHGSDDTFDLQAQAATITFHGLIAALEDEVLQACVLDHLPPSPHIPQIYLLDEWRVNHQELYQRKLRVGPEVFDEIVTIIQDHSIFQNNFTNPQLPARTQLQIFLNGMGHYGNAATSRDMAEWASVSVGTVHNCYKRVMVSILQHHDRFIHFDPNQQKDHEEKEKAQQYVKERTCSGWKGGFLCVDGIPFKLFQKPGWHGEGFFDHKSNYSLSNQVCNI
jgi:hypothetical protein